MLQYNANPASERTDDLTMRELSGAEVDQVSGGLVVIAIIAILIGMLLPAVQKVR